MEIENLDVNNKLELNNKLTNENIQNSFLESTLGKAMNTAVDVGLRSILPDFVENEIINIKNNLLKFGIKDRYKTNNR